MKYDHFSLYCNFLSVAPTPTFYKSFLKETFFFQKWLWCSPRSVQLDSYKKIVSAGEGSTTFHHHLAFSKSLNHSIQRSPMHKCNRDLDQSFFRRDILIIIRKVFPSLQPYHRLRTIVGTNSSPINIKSTYCTSNCIITITANC